MGSDGGVVALWCCHVLLSKLLPTPVLLSYIVALCRCPVQQKAASHDRTLADTWGSVPHYYGFETAGGFKEAREKAQGEDWHDQVFTGTDESMEDHVGTHGSDTEYFKGKVRCLLWTIPQPRLLPPPSPPPPHLIQDVLCVYDEL